MAVCSWFTVCKSSWSFFQQLTHFQTTNFRLFQTERVCRWQFQIWRRRQRVIQMGRKHCGKRRNCSLRAISPFPTVFSKGLFPRGVKRCHCVGMGYWESNILLIDEIIHLLHTSNWRHLNFSNDVLYTNGLIQTVWNEAQNRMLTGLYGNSVADNPHLTLYHKAKFKTCQN